MPTTSTRNTEQLRTLFPFVSSAPFPFSPSPPVPLRLPFSSVQKTSIEVSASIGKNALVLTYPGGYKVYYDMIEFSGLKMDGDAAISMRNHPFGWTEHLETFAKVVSQRLPGLTSVSNEARNAAIESSYIDWCIDSPSTQTQLDWYLKIVYSISTGYFLQWLLSTTNAKFESCSAALRVMHAIYALAKQFGCLILHTQKGL